MLTLSARNGRWLLDARTTWFSYDRTICTTAGLLSLRVKVCTSDTTASDIVAQPLSSKGPWTERQLKLPGYMTRCQNQNLTCHGHVGGISYWRYDLLAMSLACPQPNWGSNFARHPVDIPLTSRVHVSRLRGTLGPSGMPLSCQSLLTRFTPPPASSGTTIVYVTGSDVSVQQTSSKL
jgi:hypothetical protein